MTITPLLTSLLLATLLTLVPLPASAQSASEANVDQQEVIDPQTLENLKLLRSDLSVLNKDSLIVVTATQRRASMHVLPANFVGSTVIVPIPPPTGYLEGGPVASNLALVKATVIDMHSKLGELTQTAKTVVIPDGLDADTLQKWTETLSLINKTVKHYNQLEQLCFQSKADNLSLGKETLAMYQDTGRAQRLSKSVYASLKNASEGEQNVLLVGKKRNIY